VPRGPRYTEHEARAAVGASSSYAEALRKLGVRAAGGNHRTLRKYVEIWRIPTGHFDPDRARNEALRREPIALERILVEGSSYSRSHLKARLFKHGLKVRRCELCGQGELWQGTRMSLILDHRNGIADDNRLANLRIVGPNCAATLDTHCGRQNKLERDSRLCLHCHHEFWPAYASQSYCSRHCALHRKGEWRARPVARKVDRPPHNHLLREIRTLGFAGTGRRYGVSDNAVRKWLLAYEHEQLRVQRTEDPAALE
jgi:hypothetical protein